MPVTYEIDPSRHLVRTSACGLVTYEDLERHVTEEEHDDAVGLAEVIDARGATTDLTSDQVRGLVARTDALVRKGRFGALAVVTDDNVAYGMARMYQLLCETSLPVRIEVFCNLEPALAWVRSVNSTNG